MTSTLKNIFEVQEQGSLYGQALALRKKNISKFSTLGPPDLCYLTKVQTKSFSKSKSDVKIGFFHYACGVEMTSPAGISTYIQDLLKMQENKSGWLSNGGWNISKAVYCVYDAFRKVDVRAEISLPGGTYIYAVTRSGKSIKLDTSDWNSVYISAVLRAFNPERTPFTRFYRELPTKAHLNDFLNVASDFVSIRDLDLKNHDLLAFRGNRVLFYIVDYLIRKRRLSIAFDFLAELTKSDKRCAAFIVDIFSSVYKYPDSVNLLTSILETSPNMSVLLYQEAESLMRAEKYEMALKLAKYVIQLCPDNFEAWFLLAEVYFYLKHFSQALIALNTCPFYSKNQSNEGIPKVKSNQIVTPKSRELCNSYSKYMFEPNWEIYSSTQDKSDEKKSTNNITEINKVLIDRMANLPSIKLKYLEKKAYKLLVLIEREIGWEALSKLRSNIFIIEDDQFDDYYEGSENPSSPEDYNLENYEENLKDHDINFFPGLNINEQCFHVINQGGDAFVDFYKEMETMNTVGHSEMPRFFKDGDRNRKSAGDSATKIYQKLDLDVQSESSRIDIDDIDPNFSNKEDSGKLFDKIQRFKKKDKVDSAKIIHLDTNKRSCNETLKRLFTVLEEDLNILKEWQQEMDKSDPILHDEKGKKPDDEGDGQKEEEEIKYTGLVWIHRGALAERLFRISLAEDAYRKVVDKTISLYTLYRLLNLYSEIGNVKAGLLCLGEIVEEMIVDGIKRFEFLPNWLEEPLLQLIANVGLNKFKLMAKDANLDKIEAVTLVIREAEYWGIDKKL